MLLSILMGAYNAEKTIAKSIQSLIVQTYTDFELIICDDGSTDNTYTIMKKYEKSDSRIKIFRNEKNQGIPIVINRCFKEATGKYVARQDADDISDPKRFEMQITFLEENSDFSFVGCWSNLFDENGSWGEIQKREYPNKNDFIWDIPHVNATLVYRTEAIKKINGYHESRLTKKRSEDYDMLCRLYASGFKGYNISKSLYFYRIGKEDYARRKYIYRIYETITRAKGFKKLKMPLWAYIFVFKPLLAGIIPKSIMFHLHKVQFKKSFYGRLRK